MQVPKRKAGKYTYIKSDPYITPQKLSELENSLEKLKKYIQPELAKEVKRLALMGDFSENAAYQIAKGRLRAINEKINKIEKQINTAQIIKPENTISIQIGSLITLELNNQVKQFRILGSLETAPDKGVISYSSPLGQCLLNKKVGEIAELELENKKISYKILKIE